MEYEPETGLELELLGFTDLPRVLQSYVQDGSGYVDAELLTPQPVATWQG